MPHLPRHILLMTSTSTAIKAVVRRRKSYTPFHLVFWNKLHGTSEGNLWWWTFSPLNLFTKTPWNTVRNELPTHIKPLYRCHQVYIWQVQMCTNLLRLSCTQLNLPARHNSTKKWFNATVVAWNFSSRITDAINTQNNVILEGPYTIYRFTFTNALLATAR